MSRRQALAKRYAATMIRTKRW